MVTFSDNEDAFFFVSGASYGGNTAILDLESGNIFYKSDLAGIDEIDENEIDWDTATEIPHKNDLDLGKNLALDFVDEFLPNDYGKVEQIF